MATTLLEAEPRVAIEDRRTRLRSALAHAVHVLPTQGPIGVFVHHNTLHGFQHLPFHQAVAEASARFEAEPYLSEARFRAAFEAGRITEEDLAAVTASVALELPPGISSWSFLRAALLHPIPVESEASMRWKISERDALVRFAADVPLSAREELIQRTERHLAGGGTASAQRLVDHARAPEAVSLELAWSACLRIAPPAAVAPQRSRPGRSYRDLVLELTGEDAAHLVDPLLARLTAAFLDRGHAPWPMPSRERGLLAAFTTLFGRDAAMFPRWLSRLPERARILAARGATAEEVVLDALARRAIPPGDWAPYLERLLLRLPGWAGMIHRLERHREEREAPVVPSILDYLAVLLILDEHAIGWLARERLGFEGPIGALVRFAEGLDARGPRPDAPAAKERAFRLFRLAQLLGLGPAELLQLGRRGGEALIAAMDALGEQDALTRRRLWQEAFERRLRHQTLDALAVNRTLEGAVQHKRPPRFQVLFCIDDREESLRRHLEELDPGVETFGVAGFFGVAMDYRGLDAARSAPLCPVVVTPAHVIEEEVHAADLRLSRARARRRGLWARLSHPFHLPSGDLLEGALLTPLLGLLATFPMAMQLLFPRLSARLWRVALAHLIPAPRTRIEPGSRSRALDSSGKARGFTFEEQADRVEATLRSVGLTSGFGELVLALGHGSRSVNNPHRSAYDCGACGGRDGGPNARLLAAMANRPEVRERLRARGIDVPDSTRFLGGLHDTCSDAIELYDLAQARGTHGEALRELRRLLDHARAQNAAERCRRFESAPEAPTAAAALAHVERRAADLSEARPELGHATNAIAVVGRRALTRGLFLDRRAFLVSYDPAQDEGGAILERILAAVGPVAAGINLEYYFSAVDNDRYGSGTKLAHNLTGMLGVMDGHLSDLRTGLPRQMVEIHEPVRLLMVVETTPAILADVLARQPELRELVDNAWVQLATSAPDDGALAIFTSGQGFVPYTPTTTTTLPSAPTSGAWHRGHADYLPPARIDPERPSSPPPRSSSEATLYA